MMGFRGADNRIKRASGRVLRKLHSREAWTEWISAGIGRDEVNRVGDCRMK